MGFIPVFGEMKETVEDAFELLKRAVTALELLAAEQKRANDLYVEVNQGAPPRARIARKVQ
ncbi:hypothetical protein A5698_09975 [Mycobacterium sp. E136]|nr:hypothetical protein A5698_09975 [Mycobacterium sp. E136]